MSLKNFSSFENLNTLFTSIGNKLGNKYDVNDGTETDLQDHDLFPFYDTSKSGKRKSQWSNIKAKLKAYFDGIYSTFSGSYNDLEDKPTIYKKGVYYGTCTGQAANQTKAVTIAAAQGFTLEAGATIYVKFNANNTYSATAAAPVKLNVNNTGAKNVYYAGSSAPTGTNTTAFGRTNYINQYIYDGTYWVWTGSSADNNTTYSAMSASELTTGTATTSRTVRADYLKSGINSLIDAKTAPLQDQIGDLSDLETHDKDSLVDAINEVAQGGNYYSPSDTAETTIDDADYFPFYDISATVKKKTLWSNIKAKLNEIFYRRSEASILGAKNLLPYPYTHTTKTQSGITFTDNGDGSVLVNGTATAEVIFEISASYAKVPIEDGKYIVSGCPSGGSWSTYMIQYTLINISAGTTSWLGEFGNGAEFTETSNIKYGYSRILIKSGTVCNNLLFKPMIRLASDPDDTWQPYAMTNRELTGKKEDKITTLPVSKGGTGDITITANGVMVGNGTSGVKTANSKSGALYSTGDGVMPVFGVLPVPQGGTGHGSNGLTANAVLLGNGTSAFKTIATGSGAFYATAANGQPLFGILPVTQGGTGGSTAAAARSGLDVYSKGEVNTNINNLNAAINKKASISGVQFTGDVNVKAQLSVTDGTNYRGFRIGKWNNTTGSINTTGIIQSNYGWLELAALNNSNGISLRGYPIDCRNYANTAFQTIRASVFSVQSSRRYKENIKNIDENEAKKILGVNIVTFDYKENIGIAEGDDRLNKIGVIAEDVIDKCPEAVCLAEIDGQLLPDGVDYSKFVPKLIKMIQIQEERINELERRINNV